MKKFELIEIKKIKKSIYNGKVYDLEIEDNHSYNINGIIVHNSGCTTAANVSINYPMGSLIAECYKQKTQLGLKTKIVADGGMRNYSDIIKALALGADYVMIGSTFNKAIESAGFNYLYGVKIPQKTAEGKSVV